MKSSAFFAATLAALGLVLLQPPLANAESSNPAFLDKPSEIRVWLEKPLEAHQMQNRFSVKINGKGIKVASVTASGEPTRPRILPRTPGRVILAGTLQSKLGGKEWDPDGEVTQMKETGKGIFELVVTLPKGRYEYKITRDGSWNENYGLGFTPAGSNFSLDVPADKTNIKFVVDFNAKSIRNSLENPTEVTAPVSGIEPPKQEVPSTFPVAVLTLDRKILGDEIDEEIFVNDGGNSRRVYARDVLGEKQFQFSGQLGALYNRQSTTFRVWSPVASKARVILYSGAKSKASSRLSMQKSPSGVWSTSVRGDLHGTFYQYEFESYGRVRLTQDINCLAASPDSSRSMVVDLNRTQPEGWPSSPKLKHRSQTDAILYELHVRDFTVDPASKVKPEYRGKYAGLGQSGTGTTGLDYLVRLGVTDIHLLPVQNFLQGSKEEYTWGYATNLFNVVEESYAVNSENPVAVIREFKSMVQSVHKAGLRVVLDVVYNHTWPPEGNDSAFWQTVPYYYFRTNDRGDILNESGVGNALYDDQPMVRKYVRDSLIYWLTEYKIDGFRFDLIGMHHPDSVKDWTRAMRKVRPDVILYGEPWTGGGPTRFGKGDQRGTTVAVFNDRFRGTFRGDLDGNNPGFAMGALADRNGLTKAITGWIDSLPAVDGFTNTPQETINYISAHDNLTLLDRIAKSIPENQPNLRRSALKFSGAAVLTSQGVPFLEGGVEIGRTKGGNGNSYNSGDAVNQYDWSRAEAFADVHDYYRGLIGIRRAYSAFRLSTAEEVRAAIRILPETQDKHQFAYTISAPKSKDRFSNFLVVMQGGTMAGEFELPTGEWSVLADAAKASANPLRRSSGKVFLPPLSFFVFAK